MVSYKTVAGPHTDEGNSSSTLMYLVVAALLPATFHGVYIFGANVAFVFMVSCLAALITERLLLWIRGANVRSVWDGSALLTAWLLAMSLPPTTPWWVVAFGAIFAIAIGKQAYGGLGNNIFNPAMLARVVLLICFPVELTDWQNAIPPEMVNGELQFSAQWFNHLSDVNGVDAFTAATPLAHDSDVPSMWRLFTGQHGGSMGETSAVLLLLGGLFLMWKRVITYVLPCAVILGVCVPAFVFNLISPDQFLPAGVHLLSGATMLTAFFIATDMVTSPVSRKGQWVFGVGCGLLMFLIRSFGSYPEGAAFAILIMNTTTPVIDHYLRPVIFGTKEAKALGGK